MELRRAKLIAQECLDAIIPHCVKGEIVGSIRRGRPRPAPPPRLLSMGETYGTVTGQGVAPVVVHTILPCSTGEISPADVR